MIFVMFNEIKKKLNNDILFCKIQNYQEIAFN